MSRYKTTEISNSDDTIDSRDVIERLDELTDEREALTDAIEDLEEASTGPGEDDDHDDDLAVARKNLVDWDADFGDELKVLKALADEVSDYAEDWRHGATLIRESYFVDYCEELVKDIGDMPSEIPSYIAIDWEKTADNIRVDYTEVDFDGVTYLVR